MVRVVGSLVGELITAEASPGMGQRGLLKCNKVPLFITSAVIERDGGLIRSQKASSL